MSPVIVIVWRSRLYVVTKLILFYVKKNVLTDLVHYYYIMSIENT